MADVVQSTAPDRTESALTLVNDVIEEVRLQAVTTIEGSSVPGYASRALRYLNTVEQQIWGLLGIRYGKDTWEEPLVAGPAPYDSPTYLVDINGDPRIVEHQLRPLTVDQWYQKASNRFLEGTPTHYLFKDGQMILWPIPDGNFMRFKCAYDGGWFPAITTHQAGVDGTQSPSDGDAGSWDQDTDFNTAMAAWAASEDDFESSDFAWALGTQYYRGYMDTPYIKGLTIMAANDNTPSIPAQWYPVLLHGAYYHMKQFRGWSDAQVQTAYRDYQEKIDDLMIRRRQTDDNPRSRRDEPYDGA